MALFYVHFSTLHCFSNLNRLLFSTFQIFLLNFNKTYYNLSFFRAIFQHLLPFFVESEPMFIKHNISIATDDDIMHIGDDVNIYPVYSPSAIIIWRNCLNWLEKTNVLDHIFENFL